MKLIILGMNGPWPESRGATSGYLLETPDALLQMDLGSGVLSRLTARCAPEDLTALLLSHWHFDHACDLLPLIYRLQAIGAVLPLYAPADASSELRKIAEESGVFRLTDVAPGDELRFGQTEVRIAAARHPVPAVGFRVTAEGRSFGYTGDTNTLPSLAEDYRGCDLLLADGPFPAAVWQENKPHLSAALAAGVAKEAGVKRLVLTHLNPAIPSAVLLREARDIFPAAATASADSDWTV